MPIDMAHVITDFDGSPLKRPNTDVDLTVGYAVSQALTLPLPDDEKIPLDKRLLWARMARHAYAGTQVTWNAEKISEVKGRVAKLFNGLILLAVSEVLDPAEAERAAAEEAS